MRGRIPSALPGDGTEGPENLGLRSKTNVAALNVQRHLMNTTARVTRSLERLNSGLRINRAADDPAGLAVSEKLKAEIRGLEVSVRNAGDGISVLQTADGALGTIADILLRMSELTVQARNGTVSDTDAAIWTPSSSRSSKR